MNTKQTVLIIDDERINRKILKNILEQHYYVVEAENGEEAWNILTDKQNKIGAVLTDIHMPRVDGYALLAKIKKAMMTELPVIVMTGESNIETEQKALDAGAWDFVSKPYSAMILLSRLKNAIARRQISVYTKMQKMAAHDPLTGLHNRSRMFSQTRKLIDDHPEVKFQFRRIDIDHFALYNSAFGEGEGDKLLCYISDIFREMAAQFELITFGRISADIFCACIPDEDDLRVQEEITYVQKKLREYRKNYFLEVSVGIYIIDEPQLSVEEFYLRASLGAQKCKSKYGKHVGYYDENVGKNVALEIEIANEMETALAKEQFVVYFQPKVNLENDCSCGAEALVRWQHPQKGLISPGVFIPIFERNGFIGQLDYFVWEATCKKIRAWLDYGVVPEPISVNVSRISLYNPNLVEILVNLVKRYEIDFSLLELEITESAYMSSPTLMKNAIFKLHEQGFTILMDDFGSGYSSLNTLKEIEVDVLKIDMKFLPVDKDVEKGEIILASIIRMANWLGMKVIVEGVETKNQRDFLEGAGCNSVQGYYYARPMPAIDYENNHVYVKEKQSIIKDDYINLMHGGTILIVDDDEMDRTIMQEFLQDRYHIATCASAEEALVYLKRNENQVRLILVDNIMPGMSGLNFLTYCQDSLSLRAIPKIMITANDTIKNQVQAFQFGAYDYITKPLTKEIVLARVSHVMEISRQYRFFENLEYDYRNTAEKDRLTGLLNKRTFIEIAKRYLGTHPDEMIALLKIDSDVFNDCQENCIQEENEAIIKTTSEVLKKEFRKSDLIGKLEGNKFYILMVNLPSLQIAQNKATDIIKNIAVTCVQKHQIVPATRVGIALYNNNETVEVLLEQSSMALNRTKDSGSGKIVVYGAIVPPISDDDKPLIIICGKNVQLYPAIALAYGDSAAFANITSLNELHQMFIQYKNRICAVCLDMAEKVHEADIYKFLLSQGGGRTFSILAICDEGNLEHLKLALQLKIADCLFLPLQIDMIQRKISQAIVTKYSL